MSRKLKAAGFAVLAAGLMIQAGCDSSTGTPDPKTVEPAAPTAPEAPKFPAGDSTFEAWSPMATPVVHDAAVKAPDGQMTADSVDMKLNDGLGMQDNRAVAAGDKRTAKIYLWGTAGTNIALQIVSWCTLPKPEVQTANIVLTAEPAEYSVSHTFAEAHGCSRFQFVYIDKGATTVNAWNYRME